MADRRRASPRKTHDIKQLWQRNHEILRLAFLGWSHKEIATHLGITTATVGNTVNSTLGKEKLSLMTGARDADAIDVAKEINELAPKAVQVYREILDDDSKASYSLRKQTADTILKDMLGHEAPKRVEGRFMHGHFSAEFLDKVKERGKAAAAAAGILANPAAEGESSG